MATELFAIVGFQTGWLSEAGDKCTVSADFYGKSWYRRFNSREEAKRAFYKAAHRALLRKWLMKIGVSLPFEDGYRQ